MDSSQIFRCLRFYKDGRSSNREYRHILGIDPPIDDFLKNKYFSVRNRYIKYGEIPMVDNSFWEIIWNTNQISLEELLLTKNSFGWDNTWKSMLRKHIRQIKLDIL